MHLLFSLMYSRMMAYLYLFPFPPRSIFIYSSLKLLNSILLSYVYALNDLEGIYLKIFFRVLLMIGDGLSTYVIGYWNLISMVLFSLLEFIVVLWFYLDFKSELISIVFMP